MRIKTKLILISIVLGINYLGVAANDKVNFPIMVRVATDPVDLESESDPDEPARMGIAGYGTTILSNYRDGQPKAVLRNNGYATLNYTVKAQVKQGEWNLALQTGENQAVLYGIFTQAATSSYDPNNGREVALEDFAPNDIITATPKVATSVDFAQDSENNEEVKGYNVSPNNSERVLRYRLDTPSSGSAEQQTIVVTIGAVAI